MGKHKNPIVLLALIGCEMVAFFFEAIVLGLGTLVQSKKKGDR